MKRILVSIFLLGLFNLGFGQQKIVLTVDSLFQLVENNSKTLSIDQAKIQLAENATAIVKDDVYLPNIGASFSYAYLSNAHIWDNNFNYEKTASVPHTSLDFSLAASYVIFNGFESKNKLLKSKLLQQLSHLHYEKSKEDVQFLVLAKYLDLAALFNQEKVYEENINLANKRLDNIKKMIAEGMLTHNDEVRSQLQLTDINQKLNEVKNNISIINFELNIVLGLNPQMKILIDPIFLKENFSADHISSKCHQHIGNNPEIKIESMNTKIAESNISLEKAKQYPSVSLFAGDAISRPFLNTMPPVDIYMHLFHAGVKVNYNISSLYRSKKQMKQVRMEADLSRQKEDLLKEKLEIDIHSAQVHLKNAEENYEAQQKSYQLAQDNYRVVEQKYLNKFVTITDMLDASTSLLGSQIKMNNAHIGVIYQYYNLKKVAGFWEKVAE